MLLFHRGLIIDVRLPDLPGNRVLCSALLFAGCLLLCKGGGDLMFSSAIEELPAERRFNGPCGYIGVSQYALVR